MARVPVRRGLYAITPDTADGQTLLLRVEAAIRGGAVMVQYRNKTADAKLRRAQAAALNALCRKLGVPLIVNDDAELAAEVGAAGAHLGTDDGDLAAARRVLGPDKLLGASCYDRIELAERAAGLGADYLAFGSFFASPTKPLAVRAPMALIGDAQRKFGLRSRPSAALPGTTRRNWCRRVPTGCA
ncbi:MAG: thiamine phosphate synthase [Rhodospirillales bacterium]